MRKIIYKRAKIIKWYGYDGNNICMEDVEKQPAHYHKSSIFCPQCHKNKMLFVSKAKADNFMFFNCEKIKEESGYAPCRSYYCEACGGWHLTSIISYALN